MSGRSIHARLLCGSSDGGRQTAAEAYLDESMYRTHDGLAGQMQMSKDRPGAPRIAILLAVYEPRMDWLEAQLKSLDAQTYPNLRLYIRDDCSPTVSFEAIAACVKDCIRAFPFELRRNEKNLGSNGNFERLTLEAEGDCFAYCDQDDVWLPEKLERLQGAMAAEEALLVCSDMVIIDGEGVQVADSITKVRRHHVFKSGEGLAKELLVSNFVTGCTMLVRADTARAAVPFCPYMVHDHYLALWCAAKGKVVSLPDRLIRYRIHTGNQTLIMAGVTDKNSYFRVRILQLEQRLRWLGERFRSCDDLEREIEGALEWVMAREANFQGCYSAKRKVWRLRRYNPLVSLFEIVMSGAPEGIFMRVIGLNKINAI